MANLILGIGDLGISSEFDGSIKTFALGSCIAVVMYDTVTKTGAMAHVALPDSGTDKEKSHKKPGYFADSAIAELLSLMKRKNPLLNKKHLIIKVAGGASVMDSNNFFNIGARNVEAARSILSSYGLVIFKEEVGGNISRTVTLDIASGTVLLFNPAKGVWEL